MHHTFSTSMWSSATNSTLLSLSLASIHGLSPLITPVSTEKRTNFIFRNSHFSRFTSSALYSSSKTFTMQFVTSKFQNFLTTAIRVETAISGDQKFEIYDTRTNASDAVENSNNFDRCLFMNCFQTGNSGTWNAQAGGAFFLDSIDSNFVFYRCTFENCRSNGFCGAFYLRPNDVDMISCCISDCTSQKSVSAFYIELESADVSKAKSFCLNYIGKCTSQIHNTVMIHLRKSTLSMVHENNNYSSNVVSKMFSALEITSLNQNDNHKIQFNNFVENEGRTTFGLINWADGTSMSNTNFYSNIVYHSVVFASLTASSYSTCPVIDSSVFYLNSKNIVPVYVSVGKLKIQRSYTDTAIPTDSIQTNNMRAPDNSATVEIQTTEQICHRGMTEYFTPSAQFSPSSLFSPSPKFSPSSKFTASNEFSPSNQFSPSPKFTASNEFSPSNQFSPSNIFTASNQFSPSVEFTASNYFTASRAFNATNIFTASNEFSPSNQFSPTNKFTQSNQFTPTNQFTASGKFTPSNYLVFKAVEVKVAGKKKSYIFSISRVAGFSFLFNEFL